jgi:hypothetical protein
MMNDQSTVSDIKGTYEFTLTTGDLHMSERGCVDYFPLILTDRFWNLDLIDETV